MNRSRIVSAVAWLACGGLVIVLGCAGFTLTVQFIVPQRAQSTDTQTFDLPEDALVRVTNELGSTRVTVDPDATQATVEIKRIALADSKADAQDLLEEMTVTITEPTAGDNVLTITAELPEGATNDGGNFQATVTNDEIDVVAIVGSTVVAQYRLRITLPPGHGVEATNEVGPIRAVALDTESTLTTSAGSIHSIAGGAALTAQVEAGNIDVEAHRGSLDLDADAGSISIEIVALSAADTVTADVQAGSIDIDLPREINAVLTALSELGVVSFRERDFADTSDVIDTSSYVEATLGTGGATIDLATEVGQVDVDSF